MASNTGLQSNHHPSKELEGIAQKIGLSLEDRAFALYMDREDPLCHLRKEFAFPKMKMLKGVDLSIIDPEEDCVYFCGNSLGLCPKKTKEYMNIEVEKWEQTGVQGHTNGDLPWAWCDELLDGDMAKIVGAKKEEVCLMNGLTVNLHLLLISFYRPTPERYKIMFEGQAFPSDHYAFESHVILHGYNPKESMVLIQPREGEDLLRTEDILAKIEEEGNSIAVICFSGVHYYTGQLFEMDRITKAGQAKGCYVGWDLAHAVGNAELNLHDWDVDFACWCTYKYLNSGAGGLAGCFLHEKHFYSDLPQLRGWWGHTMETRFKMDRKWEPYVGAYRYRISNTPGFLCPSLKASLEIFNKTSMPALRKKSGLLTAYLEALINRKYGKHKTAGDGDNSCVYVNILTPTDPNQRGAQLSLSFSIDITQVFAELQKRGVVCSQLDWWECTSIETSGKKSDEEEQKDLDEEEQDEPFEEQYNEMIRKLEDKKMLLKLEYSNKDPRNLDEGKRKKKAGRRNYCRDEQ